MELTSIAIIGAVMFVAMLYSSVGHGGASGYLAVMALFSISPAVTRPTALVLNLVVAGIAFVHFAKNGHFVWRTFWPFAAASIPFAYLGGKIDLATNIHKTILGVVLLLTAFRMAVELKNDLRRSDVPLMAACCRRRDRARFGCRGRWWWYISYADTNTYEMGRIAGRSRYFGSLHPGQFCRRPRGSKL